MSAELPPQGLHAFNTSPPRWARALDLVCLLLIALAVIVAQWGGFRTRWAGVRIAFTSPYRLVIAAALLAVARHAVHPGAPIYQDLPARIRAGWQAAPARAAWAALVGTRPAILFVGYLAVVMFGYNHGQPPHRLVENEVGNLQVRWDAAWYFGIATGGYHVVSRNPNDQQNVVFFPAYPMLMRIVGRLMGGASTMFIVAGTLISLGAFFWALVYLFRLARELLGDEDPARYAVWLIAAYPFAWFFGAVYTESLFLVGAIGAFYHLRRKELWKAAAWGLLVGLTRPNGCFLSIPLAVLAVTPWLPLRLAGGRVPGSYDPRGPRNVRALIPTLLSAAMPGVGVLLYSAYVWYLSGNPLAWAEGHAAWGREYKGLAVLVADRYTWLADAGVYAYTSQIPADLLNALGALFVIVAAFPVARRLGLAYAVFILVNILPPMAAGGMLSAGRFSSVLFPAFIWLATVVPVRHRSGWLASFMAVQAFGAALFYTWHELF